MIEDLENNSPLQKYCKFCYSDIRVFAKICAQCGSYQDFRGHLSSYNMTLALLATLIAVGGSTLIPIYNFFKTPISRVSLSQPTFDGNSVSFVAINSGDAPALVGRAYIDNSTLPLNTRFKADPQSKLIRENSSTTLNYTITPKMTENQSYQLFLECLIQRCPNGEMDGQIIVEIKETNQLTEFKFDVASIDIALLFMENADRCSAVTTPNFQNGCVGRAEKEAN